MKRLLIAGLTAVTLSGHTVRTETAGDGPDPWFGTFSIIAFDPATNEFGVGVQSRAFAAGAAVPYAKAGVGAVATQAAANRLYGPKAIALLEQGLSPEQVVKRITDEDPGRDTRQVAVIDTKGRSAVYTGKRVIDRNSDPKDLVHLGGYAGHVTGENFSVQGNTLASRAVVEATAAAYRGSKGSMAERLMDALDAGQSQGGDTRGMQSAGLLVVKPIPPGSDSTVERVVDVRVDDSPEPFKELRRLMNMTLGVPQRLLTSAADLSKAGKHAEAIAEAKKALDINPRNEQAMYALAKIYAAAGDTKSALAQLAMAIARQPRQWKSEAANDPAFEKLRSSEEFRRLLAGGGDSGATDWPSTNYDQTANRYSPLKQITPGNVATLQQAWSFHLKPAGFTGPMKEDEAIPIVIGNRMYLGSPYGAVIALDATTGAEQWRFMLPNNELPSKRGVAYWPGGGGDLPLPPSIIFGSTTGKLYSLKAADGTLNEWFGEGGTVNLKTPEVMHTGMNAAYSLLSSPTIYKNLIITGAGTGEGPGGSNAGAGPAGDTRAWDARTGRLVWTFHTVPRPGEFGYDTWGGDSAKNRSGVNVWGYTSLDAERGILYMPLGAPNNDRVGIDRPGNNLFSSSVVAVDASTGKYLWHFQLVHHDIWDYDTQSAPLLVDLRRGGELVPAVIIVNKTGLMFTFNRVTGKPIFEIQERPVPESDVPGEQASPTQPFPVKPGPLAQNTISRDNLYKGEPQHQSYCEHLVDDNNMKLGGPYLPIAFNRYSVSPPGPAGGINFWGPSYDPQLHLFVSNTSNIFQPMRIVKRDDGSYANSGPLAGTRRFGDPDRKLLCGPTPWGELVAVNMDTGDIAYHKTLGVSDALPPGMQDTGRPSSGGVVLTASGLTFVGGTDDFRFRAFATATGAKLWEIRLPSSVETTPITYLGADGRQFVTVVSSGGGLTGSQVTNDEIIAFALPKK